MRREATDRLDPGQVLARAIVTKGKRLQERGCSLTIRWTPAHKGIVDNEVADDFAKAVAESVVCAVDRQYLGKASFSHLTID